MTMNHVIANVLAILSVAPIVAIPFVAFFCYLSCRSCEQRREEARTDMQIRIGRELNQAQRARAEVNAWLMLVARRQKAG